MADQEIAKHTKKVIHLATGAGHTFWHKVREILLEVVIIVFAVSVSIWLHGVGEHQHEQQQVKAFLLGLKLDLRDDIVAMNKSIKRFSEAQEKFAYLGGLDPAKLPNEDAFDAAYEKIEQPLFATFFHRGRYDSFKSSGKLGNIENDKLLQQIVSVYETGIAAVQIGSQYWNANREHLKSYVDSGVDAGGVAMRYKLITAPKGKRLCKEMSAGPVSDMNGMIALEQEVIQAIDAAYPADAVKTNAQH